MSTPHMSPHATAQLYGFHALRGKGMSAGLVELGDQGLDPAPDLLPQPSDLVDRSTAGVGEVPVDVALARDVRAGVSAAHGDHDVRPSRELGGEELRPPTGEVDALLTHHLDDLWMHAFGGRRPRRTRLVPAVDHALEGGLADL